MWYLNRKYSAHEALAMGLVNEVVPVPNCVSASTPWWPKLGRGPQALAGLKAAFSGRHTGVVGQARMAHDLLLTQYLQTKEAHEVTEAFGERRAPDPERFWS